MENEILTLHDVFYVIGAIAAALGAVVHFSINRVLTRLDMMQQEIKAAHKRIDAHVTEWHRDDSLIKSSVAATDQRVINIEHEIKDLERIVREGFGLKGRRARDKST